MIIWLIFHQLISSGGNHPVHVTEGKQKNPCEDSCVTLGSVEVIAISMTDLSVFIIDPAPCAG